MSDSDAPIRKASTPERTAPDGAVGAARSAIDITFRATLGRVREGDTWTCVQLPGSAEVFGTRGLVKVAGTIDGAPFRGAFMALGDGTHKLPVAAAIRRVIGKSDGDEVEVHLTERIGQASGQAPSSGASITRAEHPPRRGSV